jgi:hypothetical protein
MAGPYPPQYGAAGPPYFDPHPSQPFPSQPMFDGVYTAQQAPPYGGPGGPTPYPAYPGMLPPPVPYPRRSRRRWLLGSLLALALVAGIVAAVLYVVRDERSGGALSDATAKSAIQGYLTALAKGDTTTIARNTLCGIYDAVEDKRSDQALAKLSSDAFRKQFSQAEVTSIDKIVFLSENQAQVLFTMRVTPAMARGAPSDQQGLAQVLLQDKQVLVCSYLLRTGGQY